MRFSEICIIYNPKSTRDSEGAAFALRDILRKELKGVPIDCVATRHRGHARILACERASTGKRPLIVSSSGDGGYNEVINGVMDAVHAHGSTDAVSAVLPAGNANDHSKTMHTRPLHQAICEESVVHLDLIKVTVTYPTKNTTTPRTLVHYAHSYAGVGITTNMAKELSSLKENPVKEFLRVVKVFGRSHAFTVMQEGKEKSYENMLFANINRMAKVLTLAPENLPDDGKFEVITSPSNRKLELVRKAVKAAVGKLKNTASRSHYEFRTVHEVSMQLDGEILDIPAGCTVTVESAHKALATVI